MTNNKTVSINVDWAKKAIKESGAGGNQDKGLKIVDLPTTGEVVFRLLPPDNQGRLGRFFGTHWNIPTDEFQQNPKTGESERKMTSCQCLRKTHPHIEGIRCPICEALEELKQKGVGDSALKDYQVAEKSLVKALIKKGNLRDNKPYDPNEPVVLRMTPFSLTWILTQLMDPDIGNFIHPYEGANIKFARTDSRGQWQRMIMPGRYTPLVEIPNDAQGSVVASDKIVDKSNEYDLYSAIYKYPDAEQLEVINRGAKLLKETVLAAWNKMHATNAQVAQGNTNVASVQPPQQFSQPQVQQVATPKPQVQQQVAPPSPTVSAENTVNAAVEKVASARPNGVKPCYGMATEYGDNKPDCLACPHQIQCEDEIRRKG